MPASRPVAGYPSIRQAMVAVLHDGVRVLEHGLTGPQWRSRAEEQLGIVIPTFLATVQSLRKTGDVHVVGGRVGHLRYAPAGMTEVNTPDDDLGLQVHAALQRAETANGGPVPLAAVRAHLGVGASHLGSNGVRNALRSLASSNRRAGIGRVPFVVSHTFRGPAGHRTTVWSTRQSTDATAPVVSRADAIRRLIAEATAAVGVPLSSTGLLAFADASGASADYLRGARRGVRNALHETARRVATTRVIKRVSRWAGRSPWGGRYHLETWNDPVGFAAAELEDFIVRAGLAREAETLAALELRARRQRALREVVDIRRRLVGALIAEALQGVSITDALTRVDTAIDARPRCLGAKTELCELDQLVVHRKALETLLPQLEIAAWPDRPPVLGEAGLMSVDAEALWVAATVRAGEASERAVRRVMDTRAGILVEGNLRLDALRALNAIAGYTRSPVLTQRLTEANIRIGNLWRDPATAPELLAMASEARLVGDFRTARGVARARTGALWGALER